MLYVISLDVFKMKPKAFCVKRQAVYLEGPIHARQISVGHIVANTVGVLVDIFTVTIQPPCLFQVGVTASEDTLITFGSYWISAAVDIGQALKRKLVYLEVCLKKLNLLQTYKPEWRSEPKAS